MKGMRGLSKSFKIPKILERILYIQISVLVIFSVKLTHKLYCVTRTERKNTKCFLLHCHRSISANKLFIFILRPFVQCYAKDILLSSFIIVMLAET